MNASPQFHQLPMFMSAREIRDQYQALDGDRHHAVPDFGSGIPLDKGTPETDDELFDRKAEEADSRRAPDGDYLYDSIAKHGVLSPVLLRAPGGGTGSLGKPEILGGHHRVAVMHDIRPDELMPVEHYESGKKAKKNRRFG